MDTDKPELIKPMERRVLEQLRDELGDMFQVYYDGDPIFLGKSHLPCVIIELEQSVPQPAPTGHDKWKHTILIKVCVNKMDDAGMGDLGGTQNRIIDVPTKQRLQEYIFARAASTGEYLPKSIMSVLRRNFTMDGTISQNDVSIRYGISQRPGFEDNQTMVVGEGQVRFDAVESYTVSGRR